MVFLWLGGSEQGWRIGDSVLSLQHTRELQRDIGDHGCETASVCRLYVRHTKSLYLSPQLLIWSRRSGMLKGKACQGALGSAVQGRGAEYTCGEEKGLCRDLRCAPGGCSVINKALTS